MKTIWMVAMTTALAGAAAHAASPPTRATVPVAMAAARSSRPAPADSGMTLHGDREGTAFRSLTIEGEDRVHLDIARPELTLDLDPLTAPGLEPGDARDVLERSAPDAGAAFLAQSAGGMSPYVAHPWLRQFASGVVARFHPAADKAARWRLVIADSRGRTVATFEGKDAPPSEIAWDGRSASGDPVVPGLTYSYVFEAHDRAGNRRSVVGEPFQVPAYRLDTAQGPLLVFSGGALGDPGAATAAADDEPVMAPILLEAAGWLNQSAAANQPVRVTATARSYERANALAELVTARLAALTLGDPARIQGVAVVEPDAPEEGTVRVAALARETAVKKAR